MFNVCEWNLALKLCALDLPISCLYFIKHHMTNISSIHSWHSQFCWILCCIQELMVDTLPCDYTFIISKMKTIMIFIDLSFNDWVKDIFMLSQSLLYHIFHSKIRSLNYCKMKTISIDMYLFFLFKISNHLKLLLNEGKFSVCFFFNSTMRAFHLKSIWKTYQIYFQLFSFS